MVSYGLYVDVAHCDLRAQGIMADAKNRVPSCVVPCGLACGDDDGVALT